MTALEKLASVILYTGKIGGIPRDRRSPWPGVDGSALGVFSR
jgi:hypothetical protein